MNTKLIYFQIDSRDDSLARKRPRHEVSKIKKNEKEMKNLAQRLVDFPLNMNVIQTWWGFRLT